MAFFKNKHHSDLSIGVLTLALLAGISLPELLAPLQIWSTILLQIIFFLTSLRIELRGLWQEFRDVRAIVVVTCFMLVILPLLAYVSMRPLGEDLALALFLLAAMPVGMTTPLLAQLLGLNVSLALVFTLSTSLLLPVTLPLLFGVVLPQSMAIDLSYLFVTLVQVILFPFLLAQMVRRFLPSAVERASATAKKLGLFSMCLLMAGIAARYHEELVGRFSLEYLFGLLVLTGFFIIVHVLSYWLLWWRSVPDRMTVVLSVVYMNFTLAIYIAQQFFPDPEILLYTILSIIPWNIGMLLFRQMLGKQKNSFV
jgi:BASS family bile acid:Na+ symporter